MINIYHRLSTAQRWCIVIVTVAAFANNISTGSLDVFHAGLDARTIGQLTGTILGGLIWGAVLGFIVDQLGRFGGWFGSKLRN